MAKRTTAAEIFRRVGAAAFRDSDAVRKANEHAQEFCALADIERQSGFYGLPPEPGSWGIQTKEGEKCGEK